MTIVPETSREPRLSVLALEIERGLDYGYEIRRRSNVDIISSMMLSNYEVAAMVQTTLDVLNDPKEISRRILTDLAKWYTLRWRHKNHPDIGIRTTIEKAIKEELLS